MSAETIVTACALVALLVLSAFFSAAETSISAIPKTELRRLRKSARKADRTLTSLMDDPSRTLTAFLIGNNIVNIWSSSIATAFAISAFGDDGVALATAVMTVAIIVFSEITPKTLAANDPVSLAKALARPAAFARAALFPLVWAFSLVNSLFIGIIRRFTRDPDRRLTEDEIKTMMDVGKKDGILGEGEHSLLRKAFGFTDITIREIMTPRTFIAAIGSDASIDELLAAFRAHRFSRLPVYETSIDAVRGMIHYKDLLFMLEGGSGGTIEDLIHPVLFVPESQTTSELLKEMEKDGQNLAIVVDEHGGTAGLVTIDDAITAVFGGIHDEYDEATSEPPELVQIIAKNHLRVPGNLRLSDLNALLKTNFASEYYETVGGFALELAGRLPAKGERFRRDGATFVIEELSSRRIQKLAILLEDGVY